MTKWAKGDLGRFLSESPKRPRFEVLGGKDGNIIVWYGGTMKPHEIPIDTFRKDCTNIWELQGKIPPLPGWLTPGATINFPYMAPEEKPLSIRVELNAYQQSLERTRALNPLNPPQAEIPDNRPKGFPLVTAVALSGQTVQLRSIRRDYASCMLGEKLVLIPLPTIVKFGFQRTSRWDRLMSDKDLYDEPEDNEATDLFKDL